MIKAEKKRRRGGPNRGRGEIQPIKLALVQLLLGNANPTA